MFVEKTRGVDELYFGTVGSESLGAHQADPWGGENGKVAENGRATTQITDRFLLH